MTIKKIPKVLVIGANGQLGTELVSALAERYGTGKVVAADIRQRPSIANILFETLDVTDITQLQRVVTKHGITQIYHLAAILSATGEAHPHVTWALNMSGLLNVLETAAVYKLDKVFWPSSIASFGPSTPKHMTPQHTITEPETVYGISKLAGEGWCKWYFQKRGVDVRCIRYPGLISFSTPPGGGSTDYPMEMYRQAVQNQTFTSDLSPFEKMPFLYISDAVKGAIKLMEAPAHSISIRTGYNLTGFSCSPNDMAQSIQKICPNFRAVFKPRTDCFSIEQSIASGWPETVDDSQARCDWEWNPRFGLDEVTSYMMLNLSLMLESGLKVIEK